MVGEAPHDDPLLTEPLEQLRRILGLHQPEQKCAADDLQSRVGKQRLEPEDGLRQQTARLFPPIGVGQCGPPHGGAAPETGQGPSAAPMRPAISDEASAKLSRKPASP